MSGRGALRRCVRREDSAAKTDRDRPSAAARDRLRYDSGRQIFTKGESNGKSVGIVGSGPAGLSCATYLARLGYDVTVYERKPKAGGLDTYGMAEYKMPQSVSLCEAEHIASMGVKFMLNTEIVHGPLRD